MRIRWRVILMAVFLLAAGSAWAARPAGQTSGVQLSPEESLPEQSNNFHVQVTVPRCLESVSGSFTGPFQDSGGERSLDLASGQCQDGNDQC